MSSKKILPIALAAGILCNASLAIAESHSEGVVDYREAVMGIYKWNMGRMGDMLKGKTAFDAATFAGFADNLAIAAQLDLLSGFPEGSDAGDDTDARADIWLDWDNFTQKYQDLRTATAALASAAKTGDQQSVGASFGDVGKSCKACHKAFKD
jgi:cytochrome c556